jgi:hypothetical protein
MTIEFDVDMEYCLDCNKLDCVILHDENGEMDDMVFVPERICHNISKDPDSFECSECLFEAHGLMYDECGCSFSFGKYTSSCPKCSAKRVE